jgi:hypothetical protein
MDSFTPAYHWACAIDDYDGRYGLLVRSWDLGPAAPLQRAIQSWVGVFEGQVSVPSLFHTSLVVQNNGHRLEKRTRGVTLSDLSISGPQALLSAFERSFDLSLLTELNGDSGEALKTLPLLRLLGPPINIGSQDDQ